MRNPAAEQDEGSKRLTKSISFFFFTSVPEKLPAAIYSAVQQRSKKAVMWPGMKRGRPSGKAILLYRDEQGWKTRTVRYRTHGREGGRDDRLSYHL